MKTFLIILITFFSLTNWADDPTSGEINLITAHCVTGTSTSRATIKSCMAVNHESRIDVLEAVEPPDLTQIETQLTDHESRIDVIETTEVLVPTLVDASGIAIGQVVISGLAYEYYVTVNDTDTTKMISMTIPQPYWEDEYRMQNKLQITVDSCNSPTMAGITDALDDSQIRKGNNYTNSLLIVMDSELYSAELFSDGSQINGDFDWINTTPTGPCVDGISNPRDMPLRYTLTKVAGDILISHPGPWSISLR